MNNDKKIVTQLPLTKLWTDKEDISSQRGKYLTGQNIQEILRKYQVEFVIADVGQKLKWITFDGSFEFWKNELKPNLANDINNIQLDNFPDNYAYVASEWTGKSQAAIILVEKYH